MNVVIANVTIAIFDECMKKCKHVPQLKKCVEKVIFICSGLVSSSMLS